MVLKFEGVIGMSGLIYWNHVYVEGDGIVEEG